MAMSHTSNFILYFVATSGCSWVTTLIYVKDVLFPSGIFALNVWRWFRMFEYLPRQWDTHGLTVKLSNNVTPTAAKVGKVKSSCSGGKRTRRWTDFSLPRFRTSFIPRYPNVSAHSAETLSYLLRTAQHVSLRPSNTLLQDPALFLNTHTHTHTQTNHSGNAKCWVMCRCTHVAHDQPWQRTCWQQAAPWDTRSSEFYFKNIQQKITLVFGSRVPGVLRSEMSYLSDNVSILSVHLGDGSQIADHTEDLVHLKQRGTHSWGLWCKNAAQLLNSTLLLHVQDYTPCDRWQLQFSFFFDFWRVYQWYTSQFFQECLQSVSCLYKCLPSQAKVRLLY